MKYLAHLFFLQCVLLLAAVQCGREGSRPASAPSVANTPTPCSTATPSLAPTKKGKKP